MQRALSYLNSVRATGKAVRAYLREGFVRHAMPETMRERVAGRRARFLSFLRDYVYGCERSPYLALLRNAGLEFGDVERLVESDGIEGCLGALHDAGVYLTHDEMKGREPVRRGSLVLSFRAEDCDNPVLSGDIGSHTSGSTGRQSEVKVNLDHFRERCSQNAAFLHALGARRPRLAIWLPPTYAMVAHMFKFARAGCVLERWFSQVSLSCLKRPVRPRLEALGLVALGRLTEPRLSWPRHVPVSDPAPVVSWARSRAAGGRTAIVDTYPSSAVRAAAWALEHGLDLNGVAFTVTGEPLTEGRRRTIEAAGAGVLPVYGTVEQGLMAAGCQAAGCPDDMHVFSDIYAIFTRPHALRMGGTVDSLVVTDFSRTAPRIALNLHTGDCGTLERRECGCPWQDMGCDTHLHSVWSYAKLTAEGLTFDGATFFDLLERALPERFGGGAGDYQLVIRQDAHGTSRYTLAVSPGVAAGSDREVREFLLRALAGSSPTARLATEFLCDAGHLQVVRMRPMMLTTGKSLPVLVQPPQAGPQSI